MKFTGSFVTATIDVAQYKKALELHLQKKLREAAGAWLLGAVDRIPVWSGMSRSSLRELIDLTGKSVAIVPKRGVQSRIPQGKLLGTAKENLNLNDFNITIVTNVPHYTKQEYENVGISKSAPWHSLEAGKLAAEPIMKSTRLIAPKLKKKIIKI
jgi:hypothetical protein